MAGHSGGGKVHQHMAGVAVERLHQIHHGFEILGGDGEQEGGGYVVRYVLARSMGTRR